MHAIAEVSYYVDEMHFKKGVGRQLLQHALVNAKRVHKKTILAILLDINHPSIELLKSEGFHQWGHLPDCIDLDGFICGHLIYGKHL